MVRDTLRIRTRRRAWPWMSRPILLWLLRWRLTILARRALCIVLARWKLRLIMSLWKMWLRCLLQPRIHFWTPLTGQGGTPLGRIL